MRYCDTCGAELTEAEPFAICAKCLFGKALRASDAGPGPHPAGLPFQGGSALGLPVRLDFSRKYDLLECIDEGGQGEVWKVWDFELRRCVAMKRLRSVAAQGAWHRFLAEAQIGSQLEHPGILPIFDVGVDPEGRPFYTTQLMSGVNLREACRALHEAVGYQKAITRAVELVAMVCDIVAHAHSRGVVHRDLKPANILVGAFNDVRVIDWGSACVLDEARKEFEEPFVSLKGPVVQTDRGETLRLDQASPLATARTGQPITDLYMPPEIFKGQAVGRSTDIYSVGVLLYEVLGGRPPYSDSHGQLPTRTELRDCILEGPPPPVRTVNRRLSRDLAAICDKAMARTKEERYATLQELGNDLRAALEMRPVQARKPGLLLRVQKWAQRHLGHVAVGSIALLVVSGALLGLSVFRSERNLARQLSALRSAELAARSGQWRQALRHWSEAEALGYGDAMDLGLRRTEAWTVLGSPDRARAELDKLQPLPGARRAEALLRMGEHKLFEDSEAQAGTQEVAEALRAGLTGADLFFAKGLLAQTTPEALGLFRQALRFDPYHHGAHRHSMGLEFLLGQHQDFEAHTRVFRVLFPDDPSPGFLDAALAAARGNLADATNQLAALRDAVTPVVHAHLIRGFHAMAAAAQNYDLGNLLRDVDPAGRERAELLSDLFLPFANAPAAQGLVLPARRLPRLPCLRQYHEGAKALTALLIPGFTAPEPVIESIKESWRRHPEALLPAFAATLLESWLPPSSPAAALRATQAELFHMAADSPSIIPTLSSWARYQAAKRQFILAQAANTNAAAARLACLENARRAAGASAVSVGELRAYLDMGLALGDHQLARTLLQQWEREQPGDPRLIRTGIDLDIASGEWAGALRRINLLLAGQPNDRRALDQKEMVITRLHELLETNQLGPAEPKQ